MVKSRHIRMLIPYRRTLYFNQSPPLACADWKLDLEETQKGA
jgi:hypothetical protein